MQRVKSVVGWLQTPLLWILAQVSIHAPPVMESKCLKHKVVCVMENLSEHIITFNLSDICHFHLIKESLTLE